MKLRMRISIILAVTLLLCNFSACSKKSEDSRTKEVNETAMGRYVEKDFDYPDGIEAKDCRFLLINPEGNLELYTNNTNNTEGNYAKYIKKDGKWSKEDKVEINNKELMNKIAILDNVFYGENGELYITGFNSEYSTQLYRFNEDGTYEQIKISKFDETDNQFGTHYIPDTIGVSASGKIAVLYIQGGIEVYSADGQTETAEFDTGKSGKIAVSDNMMYYTNTDNSELLSVDMETNQEGKARKFATVISSKSIVSVGDGSAFLCDSRGIHQNKEGSDIWETKVDGGLCSLGAPSYTLKKLLIGTENDYYVSLSDNNSIIYEHYVYDKELPSIPSKELTIYALKDNKTIRQAIFTFQKKNPDIYVNFRIADTGNSSTTKEDYIRTLNTELLAKKGADILVLDGLPIDSYIEKGILEDMGSIFKPMSESGRLLNNITDYYMKDGKVYAMPMLFTMPVIYGNKEAVKAVLSMDDIGGFIKNNSNTPLFDPSNYRSLAEWFLNINYNKIVNENKELDKSALIKLLDNINNIAANIHASDDVEIQQMNSSMKGTTMGYWVCSGINVANKKILTNIEEMGSFMDMAFPINFDKKINGEYACINNMFRANALIGINSAGKQKDLAKEFVKLLFSDEIMESEFGEGFPVNKSALTKICQTNMGKQGDGMALGTDDGDKIMISYPTEQECKQIIERISSLDTPVENDEILFNMILDEAEKYLRGDITAEQAADNAISNTKTYLSE